MKGRHFSLILLPTLRCNADCEYCFENRTADRLSLAQLDTIIGRVLAYMTAADIDDLTLHWQGGEVLTLPPDWMAEAGARIEQAAAAHGKRVEHGLQTNLIGYRQRWNPVIREMFGNRLGTSMDFPNHHRKLLNGSAADYTHRWERKLRAARAAGIQVSVIALPSAATLALGAERFYEYFVEELGIVDFQLNTPFPGGESNAVKRDLGLDLDDLIAFQQELVEIWMERGYARGVRIGPFDALLRVFSHESATLPCIWGQNCAEHFIAIDPRGFVAQCDCWVTSYPEQRFGNILDSDDLGELLAHSPARRAFRQRPVTLLEKGCLECEYLALCHGGCPVRTHAFHGNMMARDPYCRLYLATFEQMRRHASRLAGTAVAS